jgi:hypothetical protein
MLPHNYNTYAGTVQFWDTSDSQERYLQNLQNPGSRAQLENLGYINSVIEYRFNSEGFRGPEIENPDCLCLGCSFTMGTGLHEDDSWPAQFSKITGLSVANLGHSGSSNDTAVRFALHYIPKIKPKYAIWLQTDSGRIEVINQHINIVDNILVGQLLNTPYGNDYFMKIWATSEINQTLNTKKNTLSFKQVCCENNVTPVVIPRNNVCQKDLARDLMHPGKVSNKKLAETIARLVN